MFANWFKQKEKLILYDSIDTMPVAVWFKTNDTGDLKHIIKQGVCNDPNILIATWGDVYAQFIDYVGITGTFDKLLQLKKRLALLELDVVITDDAFIQNKIAMVQADIQAIESKQVPQDYLNTKVMIERNIGFRLDINAITVKEFYAYIKHLDNGKE
jgi:hypothetical protein